MKNHIHQNNHKNHSSDIFTVQTFLQFRHFYSSDICCVHFPDLFDVIRLHRLPAWVIAEH